jgi:Mg2+ and Co2+ transporter CorA
VYFKDSPQWLRRVSMWDKEKRPGACGLAQVESGSGFPWFELVCGVGEAHEVFEDLRGHCPGLTLEMLEDLLTPDDLPDGKPYGDGVQLASTFSMVAEPDERNAPVERSTPRKVGRLTFQPVEIIAGDQWLISCWHPTRTFDGDGDPVEGPPGSAEDVFRGTLERWCDGPKGSAADLGIAVMHELALTYMPAQRKLMLWMEDWEMTLYRSDEKADESELNSLWGLMTMARKWLTPLNRPGLPKDLTKAWLPASQREPVAEVDRRINKALDGLAKLSETLRQAFGLLHVEHAEEQRQREEKSARQLERRATMLLVPTLVVGFYGANTWVPGQGRHWGFWVMVAILIVFTVASMWVVKARSANQPALRR